MARGGKFSLNKLFVADEGFLEYECDSDDMICCCLVRLLDDEDQLFKYIRTEGGNVNAFELFLDAGRVDDVLVLLI